MSAIAKKFISEEVTKALSRFRLPYDSPIRAELETTAVIVGVPKPAVRVRDEAGHSLMLDARIEQLKQDARFSSCFPPPLPRISRSDPKRLRENFACIARGEVVVD